ncbi:hypothetical protein LVJ94_47080 [Pendulispora rubella]|uniref:Tetratricopeptide repeat protein n=1 Tax=Pendulispora rubella TaxID=2741070 RepID=A0ABZ2L5I1_9BACT
MSRTSLVRGCIVGFGSLLVLGTPAWAQPHDAAGAEAMYRRGKEAARAGDWATACSQFAESQRLEPAPGTLLNLADCEERRGQLARAWEHFLQAETALPRGDSRVAFARGRSKALEPRVPRLTVRLAGALPAKVRVRRDEHDLGDAALGVPLPVDPGHHVVVALAEGRKETRVSVLVAEGESREVTVVLALDAQDPSPPRDVRSVPGRTEGPPRGSETGSGQGRSTLGYALLGVGAVGLAAGTVTGLMALLRAGTVKDTCGPDYDRCDGASVDAARQGKTFATVSTVSFALGAVAAGVGVYFLLTPAEKRPRAGLHLQHVQITAVGASLSGAF